MRPSSILSLAGGQQSSMMFWHPHSPNTPTQPFLGRNHTPITHTSTSILLLLLLLLQLPPLPPPMGCLPKAHSMQKGAFPWPSSASAQEMPPTPPGALLPAAGAAVRRALVAPPATYTHPDYRKDSRAWQILVPYSDPRSESQAAAAAAVPPITVLPSCLSYSTQRM